MVVERDCWGERECGGVWRRVEACGGVWEMRDVGSSCPPATTERWECAPRLDEGGGRGGGRGGGGQPRRATTRQIRDSSEQSRGCVRPRALFGIHSECFRHPFGIHSASVLGGGGLGASVRWRSSQSRKRGRWAGAAGGAGGGGDWAEGRLTPASSPAPCAGGRGAAPCDTCCVLPRPPARRNGCGAPALIACLRLAAEA